MKFVFKYRIQINIIECSHAKVSKKKKKSVDNNFFQKIRMLSFEIFYLKKKKKNNIQIGHRTTGEMQLCHSTKKTVVVSLNNAKSCNFTKIICWTGQN